MQTSAVFSPDKCYRYVLRWSWNSRLPPFVAIMLNPSIADQHRLDPTCKGVMAKAARVGCGELIVLNVGAGINTSPTKWKKMADPIGPFNHAHIRVALFECKVKKGIVVAGWGVHAEPWMVKKVLDIVKDEGIDLWCFDVTKEGHPKHPLYVARNQELQPWSASS